MKQKIMFFAKVALMLLLVLGFVLVLVVPQYTQGYNAALLDKVERLETTGGERIVLIGNSNLAFGIDSAMIEEALDMPVVNMGLHGGLGNAFHEEMAKLNVQPGDIYVICHTDYDDDDEIGDPSLVWVTLENHWPLWKLVRRQDWADMKDALSTYVQKAAWLWVDGTGNEATEDEYTRGAFNAYGDNVYPRPQTVEGKVPFEEQTVPGVSEVCAARLNALNAYLTERGAWMVVSVAPVAQGMYTPPVEDYEAFWLALDEALDAEVISNPLDYLMGYEMFYDTLYHLTDEGVKVRTGLLIDDLRYWLEVRDGGV